MEEVLPPQSVAGEEVSSVWAGWGAVGGVGATAAAARTARGLEVGGGGGGQLKGHSQLMVLLNGWNKKIGKLMVGTRNRGFEAYKRPRR